MREDRESSNQSGGLASLHPNTSVFVRNLSPETTWFQLKDYMRKAGNVDSATIHANASGEPTGSGIVVYQRPQDASRAIRELNDSDLMGYLISVREDRSNSGGRGARGRGAGGRGEFKGHIPGRGRGSPPQGSNLFVGNLSFETTWSELKDHFKQCGDVKHADVKRGFGIIQFCSKSDAEKAIFQFNGTDFGGRTMEVRFDQRN